MKYEIELLDCKPILEDERLVGYCQEMRTTTLALPLGRVRITVESLDPPLPPGYRWEEDTIEAIENGSAVTYSVSKGRMYIEERRQLCETPDTRELYSAFREKGLLKYRSGSSFGDSR